MSEILPAPDTGPNEFSQAKTWPVNVGPKEAAKGKGKQGMLAIYKVCTHLGCLYKYAPTTERFECPCHGSKFWLDGTKILEQGPAPRSLDRFIVELRDDAGNVVAQTPDNGDPLVLPENAGNFRVIVKTSKRILGGPPKSIRT